MYASYVRFRDLTSISYLMSHMQVKTPRNIEHIYNEVIYSVHHHSLGTISAISSRDSRSMKLVKS